MMKLERGRIAVKKSDIHGWGVFAEQDFFPGDLVEACHYIAVEKSHNNFLDYSFGFRMKDPRREVDDDYSALILGFGSIYNHSNLPHLTYIFDHPRHVINFYARRPIMRGEEIFIDYGEEWFSSRGVEAINMTTSAPITMRYRIKKIFRDYKNILRMFFGTAAIMASIAVLQMIYRLAL